MNMEATLRKIALLSIACALLATGAARAEKEATAAPADATKAAKTADAKEITLTGWVTDAKCGAKNANAGGKECALYCHEKGSKLVLYSPEDKKTYALSNQELAVKNVGIEVKVMGKLDAKGESIEVTKIEAAKTEEKPKSDKS